MGIQSPKKTISEWREAYKQLHNKEAREVYYNNGWFRIGGSSYREGHVIEMTKTLIDRYSYVQEQEFLSQG